jgi:sugar phosphate isomerase/epimerase
MKLGFVTAILPDLELEEVLKFAAETGYQCIEVMCWPKGKAERRYAGVTHIDVVGLSQAKAETINALLEKYGVGISGLGYYPNPLAPDKAEAQVYIDHIKKVIQAAPLLGLKNVNTFIGRDWTKSIDDNWPRFLQVWPDIIKLAEDNDVKIGIENCPMFFTNDEWPGGKNLANSPKIWRRMFEDIPSDHFGLNFDPSHLVWQGIDIYAAVQEFGCKFYHVHAKDARLDVDRLYDVGFLANPNEYHTPKLPGLGDVNWSEFFSGLTDVGYNGPVCVEVEDRAYEGALERRKVSLVQSYNYLRQFVA